MRDAIAKFERYTAADPYNATHHLQLGALRWRAGRLDAQSALKRATELNPAMAVAHAALASWSLEHGLVEEAEVSSGIAMRLAPAAQASILARAAVLEVLGQVSEAWQLVEPLVVAGNRAIPILRLYGRMARYQGQQEQALQVIQQQLPQINQSPADLARLYFTAADLLDSLEQYDQAFEYAARANQLEERPYDPTAHERTFDTLTAYFTREKLASLARTHDQNAAPVFIVGMPRSGSSLVEQILASHPMLHGAGELDFMQHVWAGTMQMLGAAGDEYPACLDRLTPDQAEGMSQIYLQPLMSLNPAAARITDKLPLNFLHLGLIAMLLPGARVIDIVRDPRDTCLSCYLATFNSGNDFKHDLNHTAHFYLQYRRLMQHWRETLDLPILEISYEQLVLDLESQTRRMLEFLGLPWHQSCLNFHKSQRAVSTSSLQQVRQPLYNSSIGRWKKYQRHLGELDKWFGKA
jgi:tetratricopeptide (TPR) repeat protein